MPRPGRPARIIVKVQRLTESDDSGVVPRLAGGCRDRSDRPRHLLPAAGIPGVSERIRVRSIVGRFLEHSRSTRSRTAASRRSFIGSADLMERNLDRRVEVLCPILDPSLLEYVRDTVLGAYLRDTDRAAVLGPDGEYRMAAAADNVDRLQRSGFPAYAPHDGLRVRSGSGVSRASERRERATRPERAGEAARERACWGVRGAKPLERDSDEFPQHLRRDEPAELALALWRED